jgi:hypothetical protein
VDEFMLRVFRSEVVTQCRQVLIAARLLEEADQRRADEQQRSRELWQRYGRLRELPIEEMGPELERLGRLQRELPRPDECIYEAWFALQAILSASANLSKLLWGSDDPRLTQAKREQREAERTALRASLGVPDDSPLKSRTVRNAFEHFDEKLERRFRDPKKRRGYVGRNIGGRSTDEAAQDRFGHYYPDDAVVAFWDQSVVVSELVEAARNLLPVAESESMRMGGGG